MSEDYFVVVYAALLFLAINPSPAISENNSRRAAGIVLYLVETRLLRKTLIHYLTAGIQILTSGIGDHAAQVIAC